MAYSERNQLPLHANVSNINQVSQSQSLFSLPSQYGLSENSTIPSLLGVINPKTLFELEASLQAELEPLQIHSASKEKCSEISLPHQQSAFMKGLLQPKQLQRWDLNFEDCSKKEINDGVQLLLYFHTSITNE
ncbi:hypothetical protein RJ641_010245, partial [Dillenia turbinata]